jgi:hypothetical protein
LHKGVVKLASALARFLGTFFAAEGSGVLDSGFSRARIGRHNGVSRRPFKPFIAQSRFVAELSCRRTLLSPAFVGPRPVLSPTFPFRPPLGVAGLSVSSSRHCRNTTKSRRMKRGTASAAAPRRVFARPAARPSETWPSSRYGLEYFKKERKIESFFHDRHRNHRLPAS